MVVICICCVMFVASHFDVIFMFPNNVLAKFVDIICIFVCTRVGHYPYFMCRCTGYKLSALQVRISRENKINATTQQLITAKISGCAWKPGSKTHSSLRQSNSQLRNEAALMQSRRHGAGFGGLIHPPNKAPSPPNWNVKHYISVEFLPILEFQAPPQKRKADLDN